MVPSRTVRQECARSAVWLALAFVGWTVIAVAGDGVAATPVVVGGLTATTWATLTAGSVAIRATTGRPLSPWHSDGLYLFGAAVTGFVVAYEVFVTGRSTSVFLWYLLCVAAGAVLVRVHVTRVGQV